MFLQEDCSALPKQRRRDLNPHPKLFQLRRTISDNPLTPTQASKRIQLSSSGWRCEIQPEHPMQVGVHRPISEARLLRQGILSYEHRTPQA